MGPLKCPDLEFSLQNIWLCFFPHFSLFPLHFKCTLGGCWSCFCFCAKALFLVLSLLTNVVKTWIGLCLIPYFVGGADNFLWFCYLGSGCGQSFDSCRLYAS